MRIDNYGVLVSEIHPDEIPGWAGNRGDSMANTSRWIHLLHLLGAAVNPVLTQFETNTGYVRHPHTAMPYDWKESDSPTDQCLPFYLVGNGHQKSLMRDRIKAAGWKTGNGDIISPIFYAVLVNSQWKINLCLIAQLALFKLPWRWSDSKQNLELSANSSGDVLNFFHCLPLASPWVRKLVNRQWIIQKISSYFADEPSSFWLLDLYGQATKKVLA